MIRLGLLMLLLVTGCAQTAEPYITYGHEKSCVTLAHLENRPTYCWGDNTYRAVNFVNSSGTASVWDPTNIFDNVDRVDMGEGHTCYKLADNPRIYCVGTNFTGELGKTSANGKITNPMNVTNLMDLDAGAGYTCLIDDGDLWCWGDNQYGQCGKPPVRGINYTPTKVHTEHEWREVVVSDHMERINRGTIWMGGSPDEYLVPGHTCGITDHDEVYCWGKNSYGQLGPNGVVGQFSYAPVLVPKPDDPLLMEPLSVAITAESTCVLWKHYDDSNFGDPDVDGGRVYCFGSNMGSALAQDVGYGPNSPHHVFTPELQLISLNGAPLDGVREIVGSNGTYLVSRWGKGTEPRLWTWGVNWENAGAQNHKQNGWDWPGGTTDSERSCEPHAERCCDNPAWNAELLALWQDNEILNQPVYCNNDNQICQPTICYNWRCGGYDANNSPEKGYSYSLSVPTAINLKPLGPKEIPLEVLTIGGGPSQSGGGHFCAIVAYDSNVDPAGQDGEVDIYRTVCWGLSKRGGIGRTLSCGDPHPTVSFNPNTGMISLGIDPNPIF